MNCVWESGAGGPRFASRVEGAPSFRVLCERVGLSLAQVAPGKAPVTVSVESHLCKERKDGTPGRRK
jgi:hypothetical protein